MLTPFPKRIQNSIFSIITQLRIACFLLFLSLLGNAQPDQTARHAWMISKMGEKYHYQPKAINDDFALIVFRNFMDNLDPQKVYFSQEDIAELELRAKEIDEDIRLQKRGFVSLVGAKFDQKMKEVENLVHQIQVSDINFQNTGQYSFAKSKKCTAQKDFKQLWINRIKVQILLTHYQKFEKKEDKKSPNSQEISELLKIIQQREDCRMKSKRNANKDYKAFVDESYLKAIASAFDPHTSYFTNEEEAEFERMLSKETRSFGLEFYKNNDGEMEVYGIAPGGPAWNSSVINEEDILLKVKSSSQELVLDCPSALELEAFLMNPELDDAEFFLRKKNGGEVTVKLAKEVLEVTDNIIESFMLKGEKNIGYIYLPSFYTNQENYISYTSGCANDVAKELLQLKKAGIEGLILDLRDNGGGSMLEAILLSGIFVDFGAISIVHSREEAPQTLKDMNRGIVFDKPLIILVNDYSASASELFAASMQDHHRALIVGSTTFGKSTSQQVLPIDEFLFAESERPQSENEAYIKLTTGSFYRVTGQTHQGIGVVPDVALPSLYEKMNDSEGTEPNALRFSALDKKTYYTPLTPLPIDQLKEKSAQRTTSNAMFQDVKSNSVVFAQQQNELVIPLKLTDFETYFYDEVDLEIPKKEAEMYTVEKPAYIAAMSDATDLDKKIAEDIANSIQNDIYIQECFEIMKDILILATKN